MTTPPPSPPPSPRPLPTPSPSASGGSLLAAMLTQLALLPLIASFQDGYPVVFASILRRFFAEGYCVRGPTRLVDYDDLPHGHELRLADAIGHFGDTDAADELLRITRGMDEFDMFKTIGFAAAFQGHVHMMEWLFTHRSEIPSITDESFVPWTRASAHSDHVGVLELINERLGHEHTQQAIDATGFRCMAIRGAVHALRWLADRGIHASSEDVANLAIPYAIACGRRNVVEFYLETTEFRLSQVNPVALSGAIAANTRSHDHDQRVAELLQWAIDDQGMPIDRRVVQALVVAKCFTSARLLVSRRAQASLSATTPLLNLGFADELVFHNNVEGIELVLAYFDPRDATTLVDALRLRDHNSREVVEAILAACESHNFRLPRVVDDPVFAEFLPRWDHVFLPPAQAPTEQD